MRALWPRVAGWLSAAFLLPFALFCALAFQQLDRLGAGPAAGRLRRDLAVLACAYGAAALAALWSAAWFAARSAYRPLRALDAQLETIEPRALHQRVWLADADDATASLQGRINDLLADVHLAVIHLNQYASQVAHELRAPLTVMRLKLEQAADKIEPRLAEDIQAELMRLSLAVEQSLLVARAEQGHLSLDLERFDLGALLEDVAQDFRLLAAEQQRGLEVATSPALVTADPRYTRQILYSLLTNALRHGAGTVRIRLRRRASAASILIANQVKAPGADELDLGLGRRIVSALVGLHPNMSLRTRRGGNTYLARLQVRMNDS